MKIDNGKLSARRRSEAARTFLGVLLLTLAVAAPLLPLLAPPAPAAIIEQLPAQTTFETGFTHRMVLTYADVTNGATSSFNTNTLLPSLTPGGSMGSLPTNCTIDRFAFVLDQYFTNSSTLATNLQLFVGFGGTAATGLSTNDFCSALEVDGRSLAVQNTSGGVGPMTTFATNVTRNLTGSSNTLIAVWKNTNGMSGYNYGKITFLFRVMDNQSLKR